MNSSFLLLYQSYGICESETLSLNVNVLFYSHANVLHVKIALWVVKCYFTMSLLIWEESVFVKRYINLWDPLVYTAPSGKLVWLRSCDTALETGWVLSDDKNLLVLHFVFIWSCLHFAANCVLNLSFWLSLTLLVLEEHWWWNVLW